MKPSLDHQYEVSIVSLDNIIVFVIKKYKKYFLEAEDLHNLSKVNQVYGGMVNNIDLIMLLSWAFLPCKSISPWPALSTTGSTQEYWSAT